MIGVGQCQRRGKPAPCRRCEVRQGCGEVVVVFRPRRFALEEEGDLGAGVGEAVARGGDDPVVGEADARVTPADPGVAIVAFAEDAESPEAGGGVARPH